MKFCAVICELNPFHNGHRYILEQARRQSGCDAVIALMSGNFVQRAEPAVIDEYARAECALRCGADAVIELPVIYAVASAEKFASGAVGILNTIPAIEYLAMGTESDNFKLLDALAEIQAEESNAFKGKIRALLDSGLPYPKALTLATAECAEKRGFDLKEAELALNKPNNILAVAYKKALITSASKISFLPVHRIGGDISDEYVGKYSSASAIRKLLNDDIISEAMPQCAYDILQRSTSVGLRNDRFDALMIYALRTANLSLIRNTPDCAEGFEYKIRELANLSNSYEELLNSIGTTRFTRARVARICVQTLLGIEKDTQNSGYAFARLLGVKESCRAAILGLMPQNIISNKQGENALTTDSRICYEADRRASIVYSSISRKASDLFYRKLLTV